MPESISSSTSSGSSELNYTPADGYEDAEAGVCVAPEPEPDEAPEAPPAAGGAPPEPPGATYRTTYGDGEIHVEGIGLRVDPNVSKQMEIKGAHADHTVVTSGVDAFVGVTTHNADGSTGIRLGATANLLTDTWTVADKRGDEVTVGLAAGVGLDVSSGARDIDKDGRKEYCVRAAIGVAVAGYCAEGDSIAQDVSEFLTRLAE